MSKELHKLKIEVPNGFRESYGTQVNKPTIKIGMKKSVHDRLGLLVRVGRGGYGTSVIESALELFFLFLGLLPQQEKSNLFRRLLSALGGSNKLREMAENLEKVSAEMIVYAGRYDNKIYTVDPLA